MLKNNCGRVSTEFNTKKKRVQLWKIREDLLSELKILKKTRRETRAIIITMLKIGIKKGGFKNQPVPIIKTKYVVREGGHAPSMVSTIFDELFKYSPIIFKHVEESAMDEDKDAQFTSDAYDVFKNDLNVYNELDRYNLLSDSERVQIQMFGELLEKFYGS